MDIPKVDYNFKYAPHMIILGLIFFFQQFSKSKETSANLEPVEKSKGSKLFWKYLIVFQLAKAADWCLGPYLYEFFEKHHNMNTALVAKIVSVSFMSSLITGPLLIGYLNDKSDRKFPCILYGVVLGFSCIVRQFQNPAGILLGQVSYGMCSSILYTSFENWFVSEANETIKNKDVKDVIFSSAFEKSMIADSITAVFVSFITGILKRQYGISAPFYFSALLCVISIISVVILVPSMDCNNGSTENTNLNKEEEDNKLKQDTRKEEPKHDFVDVLKNIKESFSECIRTPFIGLIGLTESLLFSVLHIFIFAWNPTLKELNPNMDSGEIFTLFMLALMLGGTAYRAIYSYFDNNSLTVAKFISGLSCIAFVLVNLRMSYNLTLYGFLIFEVAIGMLYPTYSKIKSEYLPEKLRGTLMNVFKIPLNLIVIILLFSMNSVFSLNQLLLVNLVLSIIVYVIHSACFYRANVDFARSVLMKKQK